VTFKRLSLKHTNGDTMNTSVSKYTKPAIWLHWVVAIMMIAMLTIGEDFIKVPRGASLSDWGPSAHASFGIMILLLGLARLFWRLGNPPPALPVTMPRWQVLASHATHWAFYALMIALPVMGLLAIVPYGEARLDVEQVTFFKLFPVAFLPNLGEWTMEGHELLSKVAEALIIVHVIAALKHQFWDKDGLLSRMRPM
jgi:cytochrome b561